MATTNYMANKKNDNQVVENVENVKNAVESGNDLSQSESSTPIWQIMQSSTIALH